MEKQAQIITKWEAVQWKTVFWTLVGGFTIASAWFGWSTYELFNKLAQPGTSALICGNTVIDPLGALLGGGTPISLAGVAGFIYLSRLGVACKGSIVTATVLTAGCTAGLVAFGLSLRDELPGFHLSQIVWWLLPFGL